MTTEWTSSCILVVLKRFEGWKVTSHSETKKNWNLEWQWAKAERESILERVVFFSFLWSKIEVSTNRTQEDCMS
jgi:hypothetical protein